MNVIEWFYSIFIKFSSLIKRLINRIIQYFSYISTFFFRGKNLWLKSLTRINVAGRTEWKYMLETLETLKTLKTLGTVPRAQSNARSLSLLSHDSATHKLHAALSSFPFAACYTAVWNLIGGCTSPRGRRLLENQAEFSSALHF